MDALNAAERGEEKPDQGQPDRRLMKRKAKIIEISQSQRHAKLCVVRRCGRRGREAVTIGAQELRLHPHR
jgi:hypothetical protein